MNLLVQGGDKSPHSASERLLDPLRAEGLIHRPV